MILRNVLFVEVNGVNEDIRRRAIAHRMSGDDRDNLHDLIDASGAEFSMPDVASWLGNTITVSERTERVNIPEGWGAKRFRWTIQVMTSGAITGTRKVLTVLTGYSDRAEISSNDIVDPETKMFPNGITTLSITQHEDRRGNVYEKARPFENYQVLRGESAKNPSSSRVDGDIILRPSDIFARMHDVSSTNDTVISTSQSFIVDAITANNRTNNSGVGYLATLLQADGSARSEMAGTDYETDTVRSRLLRSTRDTHASSAAADPLIRQNSFFRAITSSCDTDLEYTGFFYYSDIADGCDISMRMLDELTDVERRRLTGGDSTDYNSWDERTVEAVIASQICQMVPAVMVDLHIGRCTFTCTNQLLENGLRPTFDFTTKPSWRIEGLSGEQFERAFSDRILREVFRSITNNGRLGLSLYVEADVGGFTVVEISIDKDECFERFRFPSFCDAITAPVVSSNYSSLTDMAASMTDFRAHVDELLYERDSRPAAIATSPRDTKIDTRTTVRELLDTQESRARSDRISNGASAIDSRTRRQVSGGRGESKLTELLRR